MLKNRKIILPIIFVVVLCFVAFKLFYNKSGGLLVNTKIGYARIKDLPRITVNQTPVYVEIAKTSQQKSSGLSDRQSLPKNQGMLFVFENKTQPTFWMKDMNFAIDIIWIADEKVVGIEKNTPAPIKDTPDSQLTLYRAPTGIDYVLEVNAGFSEKNGVEVGSSIDLSNI